MPDAYLRSSALQKYRRNVSKAQIADVLSLVTGSKTDLVRYDEVAKRLKARQQVDMGTQDCAVGQNYRQRRTLPRLHTRLPAPRQRQFRSLVAARHGHE